MNTSKFDISQEQLQLCKAHIDQNFNEWYTEFKRLQDISCNQPVEPCDVIDVSWLSDEKSKIRKTVKHYLRNEKRDLSVAGTEFVELYAALEEENMTQEKVLEYFVKELEKQQKLLELKKSLEFIEETNNDLRTAENNNPKILDLKLLNTNTGRKFEEMKRNLHSVLEEYYSDGKLKELVQELTQSYFKGGAEKYIEIADITYFPATKVLKDACLIVEHPYDRNKIKFDDFI